MKTEEENVKDATKNILDILKKDDQFAKWVFKESPTLKYMKEKHKEAE